MNTDELNSRTTSARAKDEFHRLASPAICVHLCSSVADPTHEETLGRRILSCARPRQQASLWRRRPLKFRLSLHQFRQAFKPELNAAKTFGHKMFRPKWAGCAEGPALAAACSPNGIAASPAVRAAC
jgi:hypothetical protein